MPSPLVPNYDENRFALLREALQQQQQEQQEYMSSPTMFRSEDNDNLIKYQLDIKEELERIEHLLRKHVPKIDAKGNLYYESPKEEDRLFNEKGVNEILNILAWYLNKNILLSNYDDKDIKDRCRQFSLFFKRFIFNNHEEFGLDTDEKQMHYPMIHMNIVNTIEAAYNRALHGGERESLRTARQVTQTEPLYNQMNHQMMLGQQQNKRSILKPWTWGR